MTMTKETPTEGDRRGEDEEDEEEEDEGKFERAAPAQPRSLLVV